MTRTYQIEPRPAELGGGWNLKLYENSEEMGGGVFEATDEGYQDAIDQGEEFVSIF